MFVTFTKGFVLHALWQHMKSLFYFLCIMGVAILPPFAVTWTYDRTHTGAADFVAQALAWWPLAYVAAFFLTVAAHEAAGYYFYQRRVRNLDGTTVDDIVAPLAERAGIPMPTIVVMEREHFFNAGAMHSFFFGGKIIVMGKIQELFRENPGRFAAVLAHEVAHLKHRDMIPMWAIAIVQQVLTFHRLALLGVAAAGSAWSPEHLVFLWALFGVFWVLETVVRLLTAAVSRAREYVADVGAHALTKDYELRDDLIAAMLTLENISSGLHPMRILEQTGWAVFRSHPTTADRARALKVTGRLAGNGDFVVSAA